MAILRKTPAPNFALFTLLLLFSYVSILDPSTRSIAHAKEPDKLPLWELRVAPTAARIPHYLGSDEYKNYFFPLPYLIYRGNYFRAEKGNVRTVFFKNHSFESDLSMWGNPPVPSDNKARQGMDDLDAILEIGPAVRYYFYRNRDIDYLYLKGAIRAAISAGWDSGPEIDYQGLHGGVDLLFKNSSLFAKEKIKFHLGSSVHWGNSKFNRYFYEVLEKDATPVRQQYSARGGYLGFSLYTSMSKEILPKLRFGCYARWDNTAGSDNNDSPLLRSENNYTVGTMLTITFLQAERLVPAYR